MAGLVNHGFIYMVLGLLGSSPAIQFLAQAASNDHVNLFALVSWTLLLIQICYQSCRHLLHLYYLLDSAIR